MAGLLSLLLLLLLDVVVLSSSSNNSSLFEPGKAYFSTQKNSSFWVSPNGEITFGFKSLAKDEYLLCIWLSMDLNQTALWWPVELTNNNGAIVSTGALFNFTSQGNLQLSDTRGEVLWSTESIANVGFAELKNTGNLVLLDESQNEILWQSFAYLRDSLMLPRQGGSIDQALVENKPHLLQSTANRSSYAAGRFHLATDYFQNLYVYASYQRRNVEFIYLYASMNVSGNFKIQQNDGKHFSGDSDMPASRLTLDEDGNLRIYSWNSSTRSWEEIWQLVDDQCRLGSPCGPYGICTSDARGTVNCVCPPGYHALDAKDTSQGCASSLNFSAICASGANTNNSLYTMAEMDLSDYYYNDLNTGGESNVDIDECKALCLNKCNCVAASHRNNDNTCFLKGNETTGFLMNGYSSDSNTLLIKIASSPTASGSGIAKKVGIGIGAAIVVMLAVVVGYGAWALKRRRRRRQREVEMHSDTGPMRFTYQQLVEATNNFAELLGEGGFGNVYKGWVMAGKKGGAYERMVVAVKVLKTRDHEEEGAYGKHMQEETEKQFRAEVDTLGKIHHVNLVNLLAYCAGERAGEKRVLVYEYIEKGSLDKYLSKTHVQEKPLSWPVRYSIALGTARGVAYLHHDCNPRILHCDIKPQNVLLGDDFTAKVADFGFARRFQQQKSHLTVSGMRGTRGYMAPEWLTSDEVTPKVDVYSFGKVLLQLVRGVRDREDDEISLVDWAFKSIDDYSEALHSYHYTLHSDGGRKDEHEQISMIDTSSEEQEEQIQKLLLLKIGMWCVQYLPALRPSMARIVQLIEGSNPEDVERPPYPAPRMTITGRLPTILASDSEQGSSSSNAYSNSILSGR